VLEIAVACCVSSVDQSALRRTFGMRAAPRPTHPALVCSVVARLRAMFETEGKRPMTNEPSYERVHHGKETPAGAST
jgi:hypothetical protein